MTETKDRRRQKSQEAIAAYTYLKNMLDNILDPVFVKNKAHQWVDGNRAFWELMGGPLSQFEGKTDYDVFPKEEADVFWQKDDAVFASGRPDVNEEFLTDFQGRRRTILTKKALFRNEHDEEVLVGIIRDITAQKELEALKARSSESQLHAMADSVPALVWMADGDGQCYYVNRALLEFTGRTLEEEKGEGWLTHLHPDERDEWHRVYAHHRKAQQPFETVFRLRHYGGQYCDFLIKGQPRWDGDGSFGGYTCACIDITSRRQAQEELRQKEQQYQDIFESTSDAILVFNASGQVVQANPMASHLYGYSHEELLDLHGTAFVPPEDADKFAHLMAQVSDGKRYFVESLHLRKNGARIPVEINGAAFHYSGNFHVLAIIRDISSRTEAEMAVRDSEARLKSLIDNWPSTIFVKGASGKYLLTNRACEQFFGLATSDIIGKTDYDLLPREDADRFRANDERIMRDRQVERYEETVSAGGKIHQMLMVKFPLLDSDGDLYGICGIATDITELKHAEAALREADQRKNEFLALLAHELRNPLAPLSNAVHIMQSRRFDSAMQADALGLMERQLVQMTRLINDLLDVSRITRGKIVLRREHIALADILQAALETALPVAETQQQVIRMELPDAPVWMNADFTRLAQVFANLLNNAIKYTDPGGLIRVSVRREKTECAVVISDNGIGIPTEMLPRIFEMFAQVDNSLERSHGGLGIGLTLVKTLVEMHDGRVVAQSDGAGKGSKFIVFLPILDETGTG